MPLFLGPLMVTAIIALVATFFLTLLTARLVGWLKPTCRYSIGRDVLASSITTLGAAIPVSIDFGNFIALWPLFSIPLLVSYKLRPR